jgi:hypothetical protein
MDPSDFKIKIKVLPPATFLKVVSNEEIQGEAEV